MNIFLISNRGFASQPTLDEAKHDGMADGPGHTHLERYGARRAPTGPGHSPGSETPRPLSQGQGREARKGNAKGSVTSLGYARATKDVDAAIADIQAQTLHSIRFLEREAAARRARIEKYLQVIEASVEQTRPSDSERA